MIYLLEVRLQVQIFSFVSFVIQWSLFTNIVSNKYTAYKSTDYLGHKSVYKSQVRPFRDILLKSHVLPAELIISKFSILKIHADLNQRIASETFQKCANRLQLKQNRRTKQLIIRTQKYNKQSKRSLILKSIQKWNKLPSNVRATENKILLKRNLTVFATSA